MTTSTDPGTISLTAKQLQTARGAVNAVVEMIDAPDIEIDDQFDPVRRDHAVAVGDALAEAQLLTATGGNWSGRVSPSERQALRDALGAIEAMVTPPRSARLESIPMRIDDDDLRKLSAALDGVPAPDREDLAWSDLRFGGSDRVLRDRTTFGSLNSNIRAGFNDPPEPQAADFIINALANARRTPPAAHEDPCNGTDQNFTERVGLIAAIGSDLFAENRDAAEDDFITEIQNSDCYTRMDERRIVAGIKMLFERADRGESVMEAAFDVAEMVAWAESTRERERHIGIR